MKPFNCKILLVLSALLALQAAAAATLRGDAGDQTKSKLARNPRRGLQGNMGGGNMGDDGGGGGGGGGNMKKTPPPTPAPISAEPTPAPAPTTSAPSNSPSPCCEQSDNNICFFCNDNANDSRCNNCDKIVCNAFGSPIGCAEGFSLTGNTLLFSYYECCEDV